MALHHNAVSTCTEEKPCLVALAHSPCVLMRASAGRLFGCKTAHPSDVITALVTGLQEVPARLAEGRSLWVPAMLTPAQSRCAHRIAHLLHHQCSCLLPVRSLFRGCSQGRRKAAEQVLSWAACPLTAPDFHTCWLQLCAASEQSCQIWSPRLACTCWRRLLLQSSPRPTGSRCSPWDSCRP